MRKFRGVQKLANRAQPFLDQSSPNLEGACRESLFKVGHKKVFLPTDRGARGGKWPGSSDQMFKIAVISEFV